MSQIVSFERKEQWVQTPIKEHSSDPGLSLYNAYTTVLPPGKPVEISTGVIFPEVEGGAALIMGRQHTNLNGNIAVEYDFTGTGELKCTCVNYGEEDFELAPLTKLTNMVVLKVGEGDPILCDKLEETKRGDRGFGSTGVN